MPDWRRRVRRDLPDAALEQAGGIAERIRAALQDPTCLSTATKR